MRYPISLIRSFAIPLLAAASAMAQSTMVNVQVGTQTDTSVGVKGRLQLAMSTSFQLASWDDQFFSGAQYATGEMTALNPWHTRVQVVSDGVPLTAPDTWDFSELNTMLTPIQGTGDHSPEFQIGTAPLFLSNSISGQILPGSIADFAQMSANIVRYYNTGGFTDAGQHYQSPTPYPVTWWGIFNEPDINGVTAVEYVTLYNTVVPQMAAADPSIKFVAVELAEAPETYMPTFVVGVTAQVDVVAKHFYSTCNQKDYDQSLFATIPEFANEVELMYAYMAPHPALASVPVWITENNVNADYDKGNGISACNGTTFVLDKRGSSPFFAAWRSLIFEQLGEAGAQALYHWGFGSDQQFGEIGSATGGPPYSTQLSYWVDYYLSHWLPSPPGQDILQTAVTGCCATSIANGWDGSGGLPMDTQTMALRNVDGSVVILMSNYALAPVQAAANGGSTINYDNNGTGATRTFALDVSALGAFTSAALVTLDANTPLPGGPVPQPLAPGPQMQVTLPGYGMALLRLSNAQPNLTAAGVGNAASYAAGSVAPGEIVTVFGSALGPATLAGLELTNPLLVANALAGVHVLFDGVPAPIVYASAGQLSAVIPYGVAGQTSTSLQVEYLGAVSAPVSLPVTAAVPGIFTANAQGFGQGAILNNSDYSLNTTSNPVPRGCPTCYVDIYLTGAGATTPTSVDGLLVTTQPLPVLAPGAVTVTMGGVPCPNIAYAGAAPDLISGLTQVTVQVPQGVTPGPSVPLVVTIGGVSTQPGVTLAVQ